MSHTDVFTNEPFTDFSKDENRQKQLDAIKLVESELGKEIPMLIDGKEVWTEGKFNSVNPANYNEVIGVFQNGDASHADQAIEAAYKKFQTWQHTSAEERAGYAFKVADIMRRRRFEINAWMILEAGKSWAEADGDTAEAIDFMDFYGREAIRYSGPQPVTPVSGEENQLFYIPLGVAAAIPPWNFPCAILAGMAAAAWVTGNTVVLKPAEQTPRVGWVYMDILKEAGLPEGVVNFVTGPGPVVGGRMVEHHLTRLISFTGSREVGLQIYEKAAKTPPGQIWMKRVIAEMGGKDAIMVHEDANLDEAVQGVLASAFGFQGQKCSACSRAIVHESLYDEFVEKIAEAAKPLTQGDPRELENYMGPVVDDEAFEKVESYLKIGNEEGRLVAGGEADRSKGYFIRPTVFADIRPDHRLAQEEIFGPVLAVIKSKSWDDGMEIVNGTPYGLTGAVYTASEENQKRAIRDFHVGNLYVNRKCTGALVGAHPFGGFNMSGTDSKAGGRDYLLLFLQAKLASVKI
ncbi:MAG: L-glutamate gamma-semialdehyde dehydrogenase [Candidatus Eisenbacteria bacterium]|uniref:L-glutamate gamma-semialdehyde dehydrogenase n=1 Tax=Eiseniibacteriota bacterium TaxID=2212470 RepID=A0A7Y2ECI3_UNCEI|nr:L-glutamate gamma-semialdehyde dehydrogenase [Candidatus Eisenbacteria bacterium]